MGGRCRASKGGGEEQQWGKRQCAWSAPSQRRRPTEKAVDLITLGHWRPWKRAGGTRACLQGVQERTEGKPVETGPRVTPSRNFTVKEREVGSSGGFRHETLTAVCAVRGMRQRRGM